MKNTADYMEHEHIRFKVVPFEGNEKDHCIVLLRTTGILTV